MLVTWSCGRQLGGLAICRPRLSLRNLQMELQDEVDSDFYGYGEDVDGPLLSSDRDVLYTMPVAFGMLCILFLSLQNVLPFISNGKPVGFALFTVFAFMFGGTWEGFYRDREP